MTDHDQAFGIVVHSSAVFTTLLSYPILSTSYYGVLLMHAAMVLRARSDEVSFPLSSENDVMMGAFARRAC